MASRFDNLAQQMNPQQEVQPNTGRMQFEEMAPQAGIQTPVTDELLSDPSLLQRFSESAANAGSSVADTVAGFTGLEAEQQETLKGSPLTPMETMMATPTVGQASAQILGDTLGFVWDMGSDVLTETATEGFALLPESTQTATKEGFAQLMATPVGQAGIAALNGSMEAWSAFEQNSPQEAKTILAALNMTPMGQGKKLVKRFSTELTPLKIEKVGTRKLAQASKGRDKDVYNMITPEVDKKAKVEALKAGNVTDPQGPFGTQSTIPSDKEWGVVDEVKKLSVSPAKTHTSNSNVVQREVEKLAQQTINKVSGVKGGVETGTILTDINKALDISKANQPAVFGKGGMKGKKTLEDLQAQLQVFLAKNGTEWDGILKTRQDFDNYVINQMNAGTFGAGRKASVVTEAHKAVRQTLNGYVKNNVPGTGDLLDKQSKLLTALDVMAPKAADEAQSAVGRLMQMLNLHAPTTPAAKLGLFTAPGMAMAGLGAVAMSPVMLAYKGILKPMMYNSTSRRAQGAFVQALVDFRGEVSKLGHLIKDPAVLKAYRADLKVLASMIHTTKDMSATDDGEAEE
jgi:hypothetical protein